MQLSVVVIGAGAAGLAAARHLNTFGVKVQYFKESLIHANCFIQIQILLICFHKLWFVQYKLGESFKSCTKYRIHSNTVEPLLSDPVLSGHPLLSSQLFKSRKLLPLTTVILTSVKQSPPPFT